MALINLELGLQIERQKWTKKTFNMFFNTRDVCTGNVGHPHVTRITFAAVCD